MLARRNMVPRDYSQRTYNLSLLIPAIRTLKLGPRAAELVLVDGQTQLIPIVWLRINGMCQSARPAFQCPGCGHNRFKLFYRHGRFSGCYPALACPTRHSNARLRTAHGYKPPACASSSAACQTTPKAPPDQN